MVKEEIIRGNEGACDYCPKQATAAADSGPTEYRFDGRTHRWFTPMVFYCPDHRALGITLSETAMAEEALVA